VIDELSTSFASSIALLFSYYLFPRKNLGNLRELALNSSARFPASGQRLAVTRNLVYQTDESLPQSSNAHQTERLTYFVFFALGGVFSAFKTFFDAFLFTRELTF
jgi:hypothetical protein